MTWLSNKEFTSILWKFFKKIFSSSFDLVTDNLSKSVMYWSFKTLDRLVAGNNSLPYVSVMFKRNRVSLITVRYAESILFLSFAFQNKIYNNLILSFLFMFVSNYLSVRSNFKLYYSFLIYNSNFAFYSFLNLYYFKIKQL